MKHSYPGVYRNSYQGPTESLNIFLPRGLVKHLPRESLVNSLTWGSSKAQNLALHRLIQLTDSDKLLESKQLNTHT